MGSKAHQVLPCMTRMQTCLMCWSLGSLPWKREKNRRFSGFHNNVEMWVLVFESLAPFNSAILIFGVLDRVCCTFFEAKRKPLSSFISWKVDIFQLQGLPLQTTRLVKADRLHSNSCCSLSPQGFKSADEHLVAASELKSQQNSILKASYLMQNDVFSAAAKYKGLVFYCFFVVFFNSSYQNKIKHCSEKYWAQKDLLRVLLLAQEYCRLHN